MKKVYYDVVDRNECIGIFSSSVKVIPAGTTIYSMPCKQKNVEYERYAEEYDIQFIFNDNVPTIEFYTVPQVDIMAIDSSGGFIGTIGQVSDLECDAPICYIKNMECFLIARNGAEFLSKVSSWKSCLQPYHEISFYSSAMDAKAQLEFVDINDITNERKFT